MSDKDNVTPIRTNKGTFPKGVSGNPAGVSKQQQAIKELESVQRKVLASQFVSMVPAARKALKSLLVKKTITDDNLIKVITLTLQYGIGKPQQSVVVDDTPEAETDVSAISAETRHAIIAKLKAQDEADDKS